MARRSQIAGRLLAVLDPHLDRRPLHRRSALQAAALGLVVLLPLASATPATSSRDDTPGPSGTTVTSPLPGTAEGLGPPDLEQAARDLRRREREYAAAFARHDLDALAGFYTADAQVATPSLPIAYGARSVRGVLQHLLDAGIAALELETSELYPVGELVCATGHARFADASGAPVQTIRFMTLWKNEAGTWRIHRDWSTR